MTAAVRANFWICATTAERDALGARDGLRAGDVPANAVGMIVEARIKSTLSATTTTYMRIDDNEGSAGQQVRELYAQHNNRWVMTDYLIPITPGGTLPQWQVIGGNNLMPPNTVDYAVRLKAWVLRM